MQRELKTKELPGLIERALKKQGLSLTVKNPEQRIAAILARLFRATSFEELALAHPDWPLPALQIDHFLEISVALYGAEDTGEVPPWMRNVFAELWDAQTLTALVAMQQAELRVSSWLDDYLGGSPAPIPPSQDGDEEIVGATWFNAVLQYRLKQICLYQSAAPEQREACREAYRKMRMTEAA